MAEVLGDVGVGISVIGMIMLVADGGICAFVDEGARFVCDTHGGGEEPLWSRCSEAASLTDDKTRVYMYDARVKTNRAGAERDGG